MGLTLLEQIEMDKLANDPDVKQASAAPASGLSPQEQAEMKALEGDVGHLAPKSWMDTSIPGGTPRGYIQGGLNQLPSLGGMAGGMAGAVGGEIVMPAGGGIPGGFLGAGAGGALGGRLKSMGEQYLLGKQKPEGEKSYQDLIEGGKTGVEQEALSAVLSAGAGSLSRSGVKDISKSFNRPGAEQIKAAASKLRVKPTQGMMTDDYMTRNLENSLSQSPSIPGSWIQDEQAPIHEAIGGTSKEALSEASGRSPLESGREMQKGVASTLESRLEPIQKKYSEIEGHTKNIPLTEPKISKGIQRVSNNIRNLDEARFEGSEGHKIANQFADWLEDAKDANDLKLLKTKARQIAQDPSSSFEEKSVASSIMGKLDKVQQNTIMRQAVQITREAAPVGAKILEGARNQAATTEGTDIGKGLIQDIKGTNKQYRGLMEDVRAFGEGSGLTKAKHGPSAAIEDIRSANPQEMGSALFDAGNTEFTQMVKKQYPEQFEMARQQRLKEIAEKSQAPNGDIDPKKLLKIVNKMKAETPEALDMLFGSQNLEALGAADTLSKSIPAKVGASDTPRGLSFQNLGVKQNIVDMGRYGLLKAKPKFEAVGNSVQKNARPISYGLMKTGGAAKQGLVDWLGLLKDDEKR